MHVQEETKRQWISLGMMREDDAHLLDSVEGPLPSQHRMFEKSVLCKKERGGLKDVGEKERQNYQHEWVLTKEEELRQLQKQEDTATDEDVKRAQLYMMELTVDALKLRFQQYEVPSLSKHVLLERRKKAVEMKWLPPQQVQHIHSIWSPIPYPCHSKEDDQTRGNCSLPRRGPQGVVTSRQPAARNVALRKVKPLQYQRGGQITHFFSPSQV